MGMFDTIKNKLYCPFCGTKQKENTFQTKSFECSMKLIDIKKIFGVSYTIYTTCSYCDNWIELSVNGCHGVHSIKEGKENQKKQAKELKKLFSSHKCKNVR